MVSSWWWCLRRRRCRCQCALRRVAEESPRTVRTPPLGSAQTLVSVQPSALGLLDAYTTCSPYEIGVHPRDPSPAKSTSRGVPTVRSQCRRGADLRELVTRVHVTTPVERHEGQAACTRSIHTYQGDSTFGVIIFQGEQAPSQHSIWLLEFRRDSEQRRYAIVGYAQVVDIVLL